MVYWFVDEGMGEVFGVVQYELVVCLWWDCGKGGEWVGVVLYVVVGNFVGVLLGVEEQFLDVFQFFCCQWIGDVCFVYDYVLDWLEVVIEVVVWIVVGMLGWDWVDWLVVGCV